MKLKSRSIAEILEKQLEEDKILPLDFVQEFDNREYPTHFRKMNLDQILNTELSDRMRCKLLRFADDLADQRDDREEDYIDEQIQLYQSSNAELNKLIGKENKIRKKYRTDYEKFTSSGQMIDMEEFWSSLFESQVLYFADYLTCPSVQSRFLDLIDRCLLEYPERKIKVALGTVRTLAQTSLDRFTRGEIEEAELCEALDLCGSISPHIFDNYREIFRLARDHDRVSVCGTWVEAPEPEQDQHSASIIGQLIDDSSQVFVLERRYHLVPDKLPARVSSSADSEISSATVLSECPAIYWDLLYNDRQGHQHLKIQDNVFYWNFSHPLSFPNSALHMMNEEEEANYDEDDLESRSQAMRDTIIEKFALDPELAQTSPRVHSITRDTKLLNLFYHQLSSEKYKSFLSHIKNKESFYMPALDMIFLTDLLSSSLAEEVAHSIKARTGKSPENGGFHTEVIEECFAYLASKLFAPKREPLLEDCDIHQELSALDLEQLSQADISRLDQIKVLNLKYTVLHQILANLPESGVDDDVATLIYTRLIQLCKLPAEKTIYIWHAIGYDLGEQLYQSSKTNPEIFRKFSQIVFESELSALEQYLELSKLLLITGQDHSATDDASEFCAEYLRKE